MARIWSLQLRPRGSEFRCRGRKLSMKIALCGLSQPPHINTMVHSFVCLWKQKGWLHYKDLAVWHGESGWWDSTRTCCMGKSKQENTAGVHKRHAKECGGSSWKDEHEGCGVELSKVTEDSHTLHERMTIKTCVCGWRKQRMQVLWD